MVSSKRIWMNRSSAFPTLLRVVAWACLLAAPLVSAQAIAPATPDAISEPRHRLLVLTDIEADPDDAQSLIRLLLYSNQIDIEGLVATTSVHQPHAVHPESIHRLIDAYG